MAALTSLGECEQKLKRTIHDIEVARINLFLFNQMKIETQNMLNTWLHEIELQIAEQTSRNDNLVQRRDGLKATIAREKHIHAGIEKVLQGRLDTHISRKDELEEVLKLKKDIENKRLKRELEWTQRRKKADEEIEAINRRLRIAKIVCQVYYGVLFLTLVIWLLLYFSPTRIEAPEVPEIWNSMG